MPNLFYTAVLLLLAVFIHPLRAQPVEVLHTEATVRGFLVLRTLEGKMLASGDLIQVPQGDRISATVIFHFKDGSLNQETTVFSQNRQFRLISDHLVQKGPSFPHQLDMLVDAGKGQVTVRSSEGGSEKSFTHSFDLPPDLANGLVPVLLKNLRANSTLTEVSYIVATPKPKLIKLLISPDGPESFTLAGAPRQASRYDVKPKIGGFEGWLAPLVGKQPQDLHGWVLRGDAPAFLRLDGPLYLGGPTWVIELTSPIWKP